MKGDWWTRRWVEEVRTCQVGRCLMDDGTGRRRGRGAGVAQTHACSIEQQVEVEEREGGRSGVRRARNELVEFENLRLRYEDKPACLHHPCLTRRVAACAAG